MIAVRKASSGIMCAATTMVRENRELKERLNMLIKKPKTFVPAIIAVVLAISICAACTFTGAGAAGPDGLPKTLLTPPFQLRSFRNSNLSGKVTGMELLARYEGCWIIPSSCGFWNTAASGEYERGGICGRYAAGERLYYRAFKQGQLAYRSPREQRAEYLGNIWTGSFDGIGTGKPHFANGLR
jgi:hypothetical protein